MLVVSARGEESVKVDALEAGADDYITKPFGTAELHARIRAVLRRVGGPAADTTGRDPEWHAVAGSRVTPASEVGGRTLALTPREFRILEVLLSNPDAS